ncbi:glycoside hydrolase family 97 protein [Flavobacterium silvaticum]|uniref:Glycoside hydrolase family 97 protein n=1 Tax=Flavobacterium silvaticum TaxID=1852020 RepID=A0A972FV37_9FLAO|nr:glycoside hydrolase family 97 protein [Flavobacterium silvaticum]NMH28612.1 glycoside hydrolase family 97 protein [Flavobacterium silvaticum]
MIRLSYLLFLIASAPLSAQKTAAVTSPDKSIEVKFGLTKKGNPYYMVSKSGTKVIDTSALGLVRKDDDFSTGLSVQSTSGTSSVSDSYTMLQGKKSEIWYRANQRQLTLTNKNGQLFEIIFNVSDDGFAFKYRFPETTSDKKIITEEKSSFRFASGTKGWLQPMSVAKSGWEQCNPAYEEYYDMETPIEKQPALGQGWVYPALFQSNGIWVSVTEAGLGRNYCGTHLKYDEATKSVRIVFPQTLERTAPDAALEPEGTLPLSSPWRVVGIGNLETIANSTLGTDLADKSVAKNTDFIKPGIASWSWALLKDDSVNYDTTKQFIDYASQMNWLYCLVDADWDRRIGLDKIKELIAYAKGKNVKLILWYNSAGSWNTVKYTPKDKFLTAESRDKEFQLLSDMGIAGVKIDFFGGDGQSMISYYHDILESALKHKILVNFHGATLPRGWQRTYPNLMTAEAIKGFEFITFFQEVADLAPGHMAMLPFGRNLYDPMDFTPMSLDKIPNINRRSTTAFELALPTLFLSGIQHLAEIPEGMAKQPKYVIDYLKDIPTAWDESKYLAGFPGKDAIFARRKGNVWFITGINGENKPKSFELDLSFVKATEGFMITDGKNGKVVESKVKAGKVNVDLKAFGGFVMKF